LGLKGTISEAELHFIRARLQGGLLAKAARGELRVRLPVGLAYDQLGNVTLDPDAEVRGAVARLFRVFEQTGSAHAVVKQFAADRLRFPGRHAPGGPHAGETYWKPLRHDLVLFTLHNPRYAGAYFYGRRKQLTDIYGLLERCDRGVAGFLDRLQPQRSTTREALSTSSRPSSSVTTRSSANAKGQTRLRSPRSTSST